MIIKICKGRITKDEGLTFGDGKTPCFLEYRCRNAIVKTPESRDLCPDCVDSPNGRIDTHIPETSCIFGPTNCFLQLVTNHGVPSKEVFKKAVDSHNKVLDSMGKKLATSSTFSQIKHIEPKELKFIEGNEEIEVREVRKITLIPVKSGKKQLYKDTVNNVLFEKTKEGVLMLVVEV